MKFFKLEEKNSILSIKCIGRWSMYEAKELQKEIEQILKKTIYKASLDFEKLDYIDSAGAIIANDFINNLQKKGALDICKKNQKQKEFVSFICSSTPKKDRPLITPKPYSLIERIGRYVIEFMKDIWLYIIFVGEVTVSFINYIKKPRSIRAKSIVKAIENAGVHALPIIALTSFLVGVVVAYQSAVQLQKFGANIFIVDMIGISVTRELAPLITAIVVAGRSGSSFTAQIGAMKITRELDAMETMGFDIFGFIVVPRIVALMIAMPLMIFFADIVGIFGGMVVSNYQIDISYSEFLKRLQSVLEIKHFYIGLTKGPVFALLIASIGCFRGLQVRSNTESIGRYTTVSVVNAIFLVIACDALFSVIFTKLGV